MGESRKLDSQKGTDFLAIVQRLFTEMKFTTRVVRCQWLDVTDEVLQLNDGEPACVRGVEGSRGGGVEPCERSRI